MKIAISYLSIFFLIISCHSSPKPDSPYSVKDWFREGALNCDRNKPLYLCSQWGHSSLEHFEEAVIDSANKLDPPLKNSEKVFEMGVGVGAVLQVLIKHYPNLAIGGSDLEGEAIKIAQDVFPKDANNFYVHDMTHKHLQIHNDFYDHVVSFGALGMYLKKDDMITAIKEAVRMTKPGGSMLFTHFIEPSGKNVGSIIDKVEKSFWANELPKLGIENVKIYGMKHQGDRYQISCNKIK